MSFAFPAGAILFYLYFGMRNDKDHYEVIVIGVGSMGSATCWYLANRGVKVLGIEQFDIVHEHGSHTGQSRIIRKAYYEHPDYVPLLERSYLNWKTIETITGASIYHRTGMLYLGRTGSPILQGVLKSSELHNVKTLVATPEYVKAEYPVFQIPEDFNAVVEPDAGFLLPEKAISLYSEDAIKKGAEIKTNERVSGWYQEGKILSVKTNKGNYKAEKLVITAGAWTSKLFGDVKINLKVTKQTLAWINPAEWNPFTMGKFPCWFIDDPDKGSFYGFPILPAKEFGGPIGLKMARHVHGKVVDPDSFIRDTDEAAVNDIRYVAEKYFPSAGFDVLSCKTCLYTNTSDENFIIDHLPGTGGKVTIACGFSGHGFKFVSVVGEILADLSTKGRSDLPIEFLSLRRLNVE